MRRGDDDASAILRRVPSGRSQQDNAVIVAAQETAVDTAGGQDQGTEIDHEDDIRSEMGNENFKARLHPARSHMLRKPSQVARHQCQSAAAVLHHLQTAHTLADDLHSAAGRANALGHRALSPPNSSLTHNWSYNSAAVY